MKKTKKRSLFAFFSVHIVHFIFPGVRIVADNFSQDPVLLLLLSDTCSHLVAGTTHVVFNGRNATNQGRWPKATTNEIMKVSSNEI